MRNLTWRKTLVKPNAKPSLDLKEDISNFLLMSFNYHPGQLPQGSVCDRTEGLCILLRRLAYPCRYRDMVSRFANPVPVLCMTSNVVLNLIFNLHHHRITSWNRSILNPLAIHQYANALSDKGAALNNCFRFVDETVRPICKPGEYQRLVYNGYKRVHALKFQAVALPNGLLDICLVLWVSNFCFCGFNQQLVTVSSSNIYRFDTFFAEGKRHDAAMLAESYLLPAL